MKAAFWIWSAISSSSLNGNVPLELEIKKNNNVKQINKTTTKKQETKFKLLTSGYINQEIQFIRILFEFIFI